MVPLLPAENILDLAGNQAPYDILTTTFGDSHRFSSKVLRYAQGECELGEIDHARRLVETFAKGIAVSFLTHNNLFESFTERLEQTQA